MPEHRCDLTLFEFITPVLACGLFCAAFGLPNWLLIHSWRKVGLWNKCTVNETELDYIKEHGETDTLKECNAILPGQSDSYFEAVRVISCFALVFYAFVCFSLFRNRAKKQCEGHTASFLAFVAAGLTVISLVVFIHHSGDDSHWKERDSRPDFSCYLVVAGGALEFVSFVLLCRRGIFEKREAQRAYREEQERLSKSRQQEARRKREEEVANERRGAESTQSSDADDNSKPRTATQRQRNAAKETATPAAALTAANRLANNRVAPSAPTRPPSTQSRSLRRPGSTRLAPAGYIPPQDQPRTIHFHDNHSDSGSSTDVSGSLTISVTDDDEDVSIPPLFVDPSSGRPFSPAAPPQTPLPWLSVPDPVGPPPSYEEVMINPDYYQPPYQEAVIAGDHRDFAPPPRPATADSVDAAMARRH